MNKPMIEIKVITHIRKIALTCMGSELALKDFINAISELYHEGKITDMELLTIRNMIRGIKRIRNKRDIEESRLCDAMDRNLRLKHYNI